MYWLEYVLAAWLCLAKLSTAQVVAFTQWPSHITHGQPVTVTWQGAPDVPVAIYLCKGDASNLDYVQALTESARGGSFTFVPDDSLPDGSDYALRIQQNGQENYSGSLTLGNPDEKKPSPLSATHDHDAWPKGNNSKFANVDDISKGSANFTSDKSAMTVKLEASGAPVGHVSLGWALATVGILFYLVR